ncbi:hypothetical protein BJP34_13245 [Moorena producens PAL-8-15-08-1]|uniref:Bacteriocin n=1 Tax=Moorena producens PAL-8-15-08-1 TaxID=1458985 RepID=A0A1D8TRK1_9CYAN|nr:hypothetical protein [Moorena producens]AOX00292.1 hypothetical protein BJP34_13245 [Moorena producens PAL-8-15-08-1]
MANINVNDLSALNMTGAELFKDSESFMTELSDESEQVIGGARSCGLSKIYCLRPTCVNTGGVGSTTIVVIFNH